MLPAISISLSSGSDDRYAIPNTIQKKQIHEEEERRELRITDSLIDDSDSDSCGGSDDDDNKSRGYNNQSSSKISSHHMNDITNCNTKEDSNNCQTTPLQHYNLAMNGALCDKSTAMRNNTTVDNNSASNKTNLLDEEIANGTFTAQTNEDLLDNDDDSIVENVFTKRNSRRHSSDTFMSVYEDLATKRRTASLGSQSRPINITQNNSTRYNSNNNTATGNRRKQVKTLVTSALQTVAEGLVVNSHSCDGIGTWDVDTCRNKRMSIENNSNNNNNHRRKSRRKSLNIRAELTLQEEECAALKQVSNLWLMMIVVSKFFSSLINIYDIRNWKRLKQR